MNLFWDQGYEATGVAQLCEVMGIAKQSMYDWVGDKRNLYLLAIERYFQVRVKGLGPLLADGESPLASLRHCLQAMASYAKASDCRGCLLTNSQSEFGTSDDDIAACAARMESFIHDVFVEVLERAQAKGEIDSSLDCKSLGAALTVVRNGLMVAGRAGQSSEAIDQTISMVEKLMKPH